VTDGGVLALRSLCKPSVRAGGIFFLRKTRHTIDVAQTGFNQVGDMQLSGLYAGTERIHAHITEIFAVRHRSDAERI